LGPGEFLRRGISSLRPGIRTAFEAGTGVNIFRKEAYPQGTQIGWGEVMKAFPQALMGNSGTPLDSLVSVRPLREYMPGGRVAAMQTKPAAATRAVLGGALQPASSRAGYAAKYAKLRAAIWRLRTEFARAREAGEEARARAKATELMRLYQQLRAMGLPGVPKATESMLQGAGLPAGQPAFAG
ncbi:MAG TPA: hypothetical protein VMZ50_13505, partial [Phycisphaerae bacterium]|nr:hypothetical protein [Phycisphaerae bacterium]